jgi:hypothetical protein
MFDPGTVNWTPVMGLEPALVMVMVTRPPPTHVLVTPKLMWAMQELVEEEDEELLLDELVVVAGAEGVTDGLPVVVEAGVVGAVGAVGAVDAEPLLELDEVVEAGVVAVPVVAEAAVWVAAEPSLQLLSVAVLIVVHSQVV